LLSLFSTVEVETGNTKQISTLECPNCTLTTESPVRVNSIELGLADAKPSGLACR
jgi:hypothetical protein